jgi:hypothetical protein
MGLIVWLSDFGPLKNPVFPLWWDIVVTVAFSLAIYYWALHTALPTDRIEALMHREEEIAEEESEALGATPQH